MLFRSDKAFSEISDIQGTMIDPRFFTYRASLRLSVGGVFEAESDIKQSLSLRPMDGDALAQIGRASCRERV